MKQSVLAFLPVWLESDEYPIRGAGPFLVGDYHISNLLT